MDTQKTKIIKRDRILLGTKRKTLDIRKISELVEKIKKQMKEEERTSYGRMDPA